MRSQSRFFSQPFRKIYRRRTSPRLKYLRAVKKSNAKRARSHQRHAGRLRPADESVTPEAVRAGRLFPVSEEHAA